MFSVVDHPNPGLGETASNTVLHSSGAASKAAQIVFRRETESLPDCAVTPLITNVGEPPTEYFSLSDLWISNLGYLPLSHVDLSSRFSVTLNSASALVVHVASFAVSIPVEARHPFPSPAVRKQVR